MTDLPTIQFDHAKAKICDKWTFLKCFTPARIALGRTGTSVPLKEALNFKLAHSNARDAVYSCIDINKLYFELLQFNLPVLFIKSKATSRQEYLQRPDLGRQPDQESLEQLKSFSSAAYDIVVIVADGLSAKAIHQHALSLLKLLVPALQLRGISVAPIIGVKNARVALGDEVGELLKAKLSIMLIGERPGLSSSDSLGAYLTYSPKKGLTDEARNCVSNIHTQGLQYYDAHGKIMYFVEEALREKNTGVKLKESLEFASNKCDKAETITPSANE